MSEFKITAAICTHNRAADVTACVNALMAQMKPGIQVILCDSASSPENAAIVAKLAAQYPEIEFFRVDKPGVALARNELLRRTKGKWFALIDDDAAPDPDWTEVALELADKVTDEYAIVGGFVRPVMPPDPPEDAVNPAQMGPRWMQLVSAVQLKGEFDQTLKPKVVGANMWFRPGPLREIGGFPENLGRVGRSLLSGEDKLPVHMLLEKGWRIWYCDRLKVGHKVHRERLTKKWAAHRSYYDGVSDRRITRMLHTKLKPGYSFIIAAKMAALAPLYGVASPKHEFFLRFWYDLGWLHETLLPRKAPAA